MSEYGRLREDIVAPIRQLRRKLSIMLNKHEDNLPKTPTELRERVTELSALADQWEKLEADFKALNARQDLE